MDRNFDQTTPKVDVYVLANGSAAGVSLHKDSDWADVHGALLKENAFGLSPAQTSVPDVGLPMSGVGIELPVQRGTDPDFSLETVTLVRAVSKIRFVFSQKEETVGFNPENVMVKEVVLLGNQIPETENLFTTSAPDVSDTYLESEYVISGEGRAIGYTPAPENYAWVDQSPDEYRELLDAAVKEGKLTDFGTTYFRESDKQLNGIIRYKIGSLEDSRVFQMNVPNGFARNRSWTVYGYFVSDNMIQLAVSVLPWEETEPWVYHHID